MQASNTFETRGRVPDGYRELNDQEIILKDDQVYVFSDKKFTKQCGLQGNPYSLENWQIGVCAIVRPIEKDVTDSYEGFYEALVKNGTIKETTNFVVSKSAQITEACKSKEEFTAKLRVLQSLGLKFKDAKETPELYSRYFESYPRVGLESGGHICAWTNSAAVTPIAFADLITNYFNQVSEKAITIELNNEYTATITKKQVVVGCQTFPMPIVKAFITAVEKVEKN